MVNLSASNDCVRCPEETNNPIFYGVVHDLGFPGSSSPHAVKVIEGETVETGQKIS